MPERRGFPVGPVVRRAAAQWQLLAAVLVVMVLSGALVGVGVLLVGPGRQAALGAAAASVDGTGTTSAASRADLVVVTARTDGASDDDPPGARAVVDDLLPALRQALAPLDATESVWVSTPPTLLPGAPARLAYLLDADTVQQHATVVAGRWPASGGGATGGPTEVVLPSATAQLLGLAVGDRLSLAATPLTVVGLVEHDASGAWDRDRLRGVAADVDSGWLPVYGPFIVAPGTVLAAGTPVGRVSIEADVDLTAHADALGATAARVAALGGTLDGVAGDQLASVTVSSRLPGFVADARRQLDVTAALVLTTVLLVATLAGAAIALLARLLATRRSTDTALLADRGASRSQLAGAAAGEGLLLALVGVVAAVPLAALGYRAVTSTGPLAEAWTEGGAGPAWPTAAGWLLVTGCVAVGTLALAAVGVVLSVRGGGPSREGRHVVAGGVARSGVDVLLVALAVLGVLQLRAHRFDGGAPDPVLVLAPTLALVAAAAVALRVVAPLGRGAELAARRGRGLAVPLAGWQVARGRATSGVFLVALAAASLTFALVFQATWLASQRDQGAAAVGTDVRVPVDGTPDQGARVSAAAGAPGAGGAAVAAATHRTVTLGSRPGGVTLVAVDTSRADLLVRGRLGGSATWWALTEPVRPGEASAGLVVSGNAVPIEVTGGLEGVDDVALPAHVTLVLEGERGERVAAAAPDVVLDGTAQPVTVTAPSDATWRIVGLRVVVPGGVELSQGDQARLEVVVRVPGAMAREGDPAAWTAYADESADDGALAGRPVAEAGADTLGFSAPVSRFELGFTSVEVVVAGFGPTEPVPVLASASLADQLGVAVGDALDLGVASVVLPAVVAGVLPYVPSAPDDPAVLADVDTLSRALLQRGDLDSVVDEWWVATDHSEAVAAATGGVSRTALQDALTAGPLRAAAAVALALLVVAALALAMAGTVARELAVAHDRSAETARLRALGVPRRLVSATGAARHVILTTVAVGLGALAGGGLSLVLGALLVTARDGGAPVPGALVVWPWAALLVLLGTLLAGCTLVGLPPARRVARRSTAASLRAGAAR
ncbi:hypothetical protein HP550_16005 [Cellulomonas humilata]|uniref:ABC3 transporter permease protein domain-containing protein n=1 Tax=Cellulomonas humilata TaxID=144055 RepID=A0A7Y6DXP8_9CELL|nr:hypothetical protein [Cellulomonas humilata]NUU18756.1 hypothetical protein [Cellulomonas humilata]